jgi:hypothetical protein
VIERIRSAGGSIRVTAEGKIAARAIPDSLRVELQQNREAIIEILWQEVRLWPAKGSYSDSKLSTAVDRLYRYSKTFNDNFDVAVEAMKLQKLLIEFDQDCQRSHAAALDSFRTIGPTVIELTDMICETVSPGTLIGAQLRSACKEIFKVVP